MKQINFGYTDTPINGVTSLEFARGLINHAADFRVKEDTAAEAILTNLTSPIDRPEKFRIAISQIDNIYKGSGISSAVQAPSMRGANLLVQLTEIASITDDTDPAYRVDAPLSAHLVIKAPALAEVTEAHVLMLVGRLFSGLFETGSTSTSRLKAMLRGALVPTDL